jgi:hypothetical protein
MGKIIILGGKFCKKITLILLFNRRSPDFSGRRWSTPQKACSLPASDSPTPPTTLSAVTFLITEMK